MIRSLRELLTYRELLLTWTLREIKVRYKQSVLGAIWAVLQPLSLMVIFTIVFGFFVKVPTGNTPYPVFSYVALLPWTFFSASISSATLSLTNNINLVTKIYFPREILPLASIGAAFLDYLVAFGLFIVLIVIYQVPITINWLFLPLLLLIQIVLTVGISIFSAATIVLYRDVRFIVPLALQLWMYLTPVVYPVELVPEKWRALYLLNPMASIIDGYRRVVLDATPPRWEAMAFSAIISIGFFFLSYAYFKRSESTFADVI